MARISFVDQVEGTTYGTRVKLALALGRAVRAGDTSAQSQVEALRASPQAYDRLLALLTIHGSQDGEQVVLALSDPSRTVRRLAATLVAKVCDDPQASRALDAVVGKRLRKSVLLALRRQRRFAVVDRFLRGFAPGSESEQAHVLELLPFGSEALLLELRPALEDQFNNLLWRRLACFHPKLTAGWCTDLLNRLPAMDPRQRYRIIGLLETLARQEPDAALSVVQALLKLGEEPHSLAEAFRWLVRFRPLKAFDLLKAHQESARPARPPGAFAGLSFDQGVRKLGPERLSYLVEKACTTLGDGDRGPQWFLRLPYTQQRAVLAAFLKGKCGSWGGFLFRYLRTDTAEEAKLREQAFERWYRAAQSADGTIDVEVLDSLPRDLREREGRRHLHHCQPLEGKPERRLTYARLLSFSEAKTALAPFIGHPEGEERARAWRGLLGSTKHDRGALGEALRAVKARKFEQDPVRQALLESLAELPITPFASHLEVVGQILTDALEAADLSPASSAAAERWVGRLSRLDCNWGAGWLEQIWRVRGQCSCAGIGQILLPEAADALSLTLGSLAVRWASRERSSTLISLAHHLGLRLKRIPPLLEALEKLVQTLPLLPVVNSALALIKEHDGARFSRLVPQLLASDPSFVLVPCVASHLSLARQDLLTPLLRGKPMEGRFASGRTHWVLDFERGFARWTAAQQELYAAGLQQLLADPHREVPTLRFAISRWIRLPFVDAAALLPYAADPRPALRETTLRGLPHLDQQQGLSVLIEALGDDRARYAIYALRKAFSELPTSRVLTQLRAVQSRKITVMKEVIRLLGELPGEAAYRELLRANRPDAHRDLRIALQRALWNHLDREETWAVFEGAATDPDWAVAAKLAEIPIDTLNSDGERRVAALLSTLLARREPECRRHLLGCAANLPLRDPARLLFQGLLNHLDADSPEEAALAFGAVLQRMEATELPGVAKKLQGVVPRRKHWGKLLPVLTGRLGPYRPEPIAGVARALLRILGEDPTSIPQFLTLGARLWGWEELGAAVIDLGERDFLYFDAIAAALAAVRASLHPEHLEALLRSQNSPVLRRLGLAALEQSAAPEFGWTEERRALLIEYQRDPSPAVRGPASFVIPP